MGNNLNEVIDRLLEFLQPGCAVVAEIKQNPVYTCPLCGRPGYMSIYGNYCTACANSKRGLL